MDWSTILAVAMIIGGLTCSVGFYGFWKRAGVAEDVGASQALLFLTVGVCCLFYFGFRQNLVAAVVTVVIGLTVILIRQQRIRLWADFLADS